MRRLVFFIALFASSIAYAEYRPLSHSRLPNESWEDAFKRYEKEGRLPFLGASKAKSKTSVMGSRVKFEELDISTVPEWNSVEELEEVFQRVRDLRYLEADRDPAFPRRISWLYPDDGCFARAAMARQQIEDQWGHRLAKLFSFGNLSVETTNHPSGRVDWAWHVVPAARVGDVLYVMDPAIDPHRLLTAEQWALKQVKKLKNASFTICNSYAYVPEGACLDATAEEEAEALEDQRQYLGYEWRRIERMKRDPEKELGDFPPWLENDSAFQIDSASLSASP